ncbi:hypothetical protein WJX81_001100 [Elliptochloris bilobata]|uniref:Uncharacterized protein n=1 Tax=Elliptochloris bilobata TaxID=381761 RepID=A0AAW1RKB9_9CHLO
MKALVEGPAARVAQEASYERWEQGKVARQSKQKLAERMLAETPLGSPPAPGAPAPSGGPGKCTLVGGSG